MIGWIAVGAALAAFVIVILVGVLQNKKELRERARRGTKKKEKVLRQGNQ